MNVTDDLEQTARNIAAARSIDVDNASSIAPWDTEEVKNKSEEGKGMGRIPGFNLAEDSRGRGLSKIVEQQNLFKEAGGDMWITVKPGGGGGAQGEWNEKKVRWMLVQETHPPWKWCNQTRKTWKSLAARSRRKQ